MYSTPYVDMETAISGLQAKLQSLKKSASSSTTTTNTTNITEKEGKGLEGTVKNGSAPLESGWFNNLVT